MPSYLYRCDQCGGELEMSHSIPSNGDLSPLCCSYPMIRVFSAPAIIFKGTGWGKDKT
jgi:putative FmdB family regulatory protein